MKTLLIIAAQSALFIVGVTLATAAVVLAGVWLGGVGI
jgi:hypothetical protein